MPSEHAEQVTVINWFRREYHDLIIFAIPNGELRHPMVAARLKSEGVTPGIPDLCIIKDDAVIWVEMKAQGGRLSNVQKEIHQKMRGLKHTVLVCYGFKDAIEQIKENL